MLTFPQISPVIVQIGPLALRWYGLMYAVSFYLLLQLMRKSAQSRFLPLDAILVERLFLYLVVFILAGARVFYVLFYGNSGFLKDPLEIFALWHGGMSFHGGLAGIAIASFLIAKKAKIPWRSVLDTLVLCGPVGIFLGRIGNFINGELYGRVTEVPWGMVFPNAGSLPRHPSQLYEAFFEGLVLTVVLWILRGRVKRYGVLTGVFLVGYALCRIALEFFREPDVQLGFVLGPFTMGQLLSLGILIPGAVLLAKSLKNGPLIEQRLNLKTQQRKKSA
ncbi:MAG: prolipoprotein diacylglyceryl transferase [Bdellovibrionota bacterium]